MKKSWKERLYDVSCSRFVEKHIPILPLGIGLLSVVGMFVFGLVFDCMLLSTILYFVFLIMPTVGIELRVFFDAVKSYNKETFLCNKFRYLLLANESIIYNTMGFLLIIIITLVLYVIFNDNTYILKITAIFGCIASLIFSIVVSKPISKHFKKNLVYIQNDTKNVKAN